MARLILDFDEFIAIIRLKVNLLSLFLKDTIDYNGLNG